MSRVWASLTLLLAACAGGPPPPDWQVGAHGALERSVAAYLEGNGRVAEREFERGRAELARTGRADLVARAELMRCAARVASAVLEPCAGFEALRADAAAPERAYADYLDGRALAPQELARLPPWHRAVAAGGDKLPDGADPLARLVAAGVLLRAGRASPAVLAQAVDQASAQGWRRPLLAWLGLQLRRAELGGDAAEAERLRRRMDLVQGQR